MPAPLTLWRIDQADHLAGNPDVLAIGLRRHLRVAPLQSILVQLGNRQQAYFMLRGCAGCAVEQCVEGCHVDLLRRTLRAAGGIETTLQRIAHGLVPQLYRHILWAWPATRDTTPISAAILAGWPLARLTLRWTPGTTPRVGALVALGGETEGPPVAPQLAACGWNALPIPPALHRWAGCLPGEAIGSGSWRYDPWLLTPTQHQVEAIP